MSTEQITLTIKVSWWVKWYIRGVAYMCALTGQDPDMDKVAYWVRKGLLVKVR